MGETAQTTGSLNEEPFIVKLVLVALYELLATFIGVYGIGTTLIPEAVRIYAVAFTAVAVPVVIFSAGARDAREWIQRANRTVVICMAIALACGLAMAIVLGPGMASFFKG